MSFSNIKVKLCGFSEPSSLLTAVDLKPDFIGFIFHEKSPRHISFEKAQELAKLVPASIAKVAVMVDPNFTDLKNASQSLQPQYFQLHGTQNKTQLLEIKNYFPNIKIIKAIAVSSKKDLEQSVDFLDVADIILFDNAVSGSGKSFDWNILKDFHGTKNYFLSGGLNCDNILTALRVTGATMVDVSSGIEKERGKKSDELIIAFMKKIKNVA